MKTKDIAKQYGFEQNEFETFINHRPYFNKTNGIMGMAIADSDVKKAVEQFIEEQEKKKAAEEERKRKQEEREAEKRRLEQEKLKAAKRKEEKKRHLVETMLLSSGQSFDGYSISKYVDCVSADSVFHVNLYEILNTDTRQKEDEEFEKALAQNRKKVLKKIKEAAADKDCNAIIGLRFDVATIDQWSINHMVNRVEPGPHVICVSAYGSAVVIEKN